MSAEIKKEEAKKCNHVFTSCVGNSYKCETCGYVKYVAPDSYYRDPYCLGGR